MTNFWLMSNSWPYWCAPSWFSEIELSGKILIIKFPRAVDVMWLSKAHPHIPPLLHPKMMWPFRSWNICRLSPELSHTGDSCYLSSNCTHSSCTDTPPLPRNAVQDCALIQDCNRVKQNRHFVQDVYCFHHNILKVREIKGVRETWDYVFAATK